MKKLIIIASLFLVACTPKRDTIPTFWEQTPMQAQIAANLHANEVGGVAYLVAPTGSMEPFITGGDFVVVKPVPYSTVHVGMAANYQARWRPPESPTVTHWVAAKLGDEWVMDGQANKYYERDASQLMGEKEFRGQVIAIYTQRKGPK
jgi:hypothetical protein